MSSNSHLFRMILPAKDTYSTDSFSAPSVFFASASTILISSTHSSGFLSQESPITDMCAQSASLRDSLVLAVDYLWFSWRSMSCFASLHDRIRAGRSESLSFSLAVTCTCPRSCDSCRLLGLLRPASHSSDSSLDFRRVILDLLDHQLTSSWMVGFFAQSL